MKTLLTHPLIRIHRPKILLVTPPPVDERQCEIKDAGNGLPLSRIAKVTAMYASVVREIGAELPQDIVVVDMWKAIMEEALKITCNDTKDVLLGSKDIAQSDALVNLLPDGLHLSSTGYMIFFRELLSAIKTEWPENDPPADPTDSYIFPYWAKAPRMGKS